MKVTYRMRRGIDELRHHLGSTNEQLLTPEPHWAETEWEMVRRVWCEFEERYVIEIEWGDDATGETQRHVSRALTDYYHDEGG